jgi:hypothetical protein
MDFKTKSVQDIFGQIVSMIETNMDELMPSLFIQQIGTVSTVTDTKDIVGVNTSFTIHNAGDIIKIGDNEYVIDSITDDTNLLVTTNAIADVETSLYSLRQPFKIKYYYSTPIEFVNIVGKEAKKHKFPFFFVNALNTKYNKDIVSINDIVIATATRSDWTSSKRKVESYDPILTPILNDFYRILRIHHNISLSDEGDTIFQMFYGDDTMIGHDSAKFDCPIDAIQLKDFKFRVTQNY